MIFSERMGLKPIKNKMQKDDIDEGTRARLWNVLDISCWNIIPKHNGQLIVYPSLGMLVRNIWSQYFKKPIDTIEDWFPETYKEIRKYFFSCKWYEVYDFIEFIIKHFPKDDSDKTEFVKYCNSILKEELSAYRFIGENITPITSEEEIGEIEQALENTDALNGVNTHLKTALEKISDRKIPDYRNSIKESISAVESICKSVAKDEKTTLTKALEKISNVNLHPNLKDAFTKLYWYTSDAEGIRHALMEESNLDFEDAKFMLVSCSAFVNYLISKSEKAGIKLD